MEQPRDIYSQCCSAHLFVSVVFCDSKETHDEGKYSNRSRTFFTQIIKAIVLASNKSYLTLWNT